MQIESLKVFCDLAETRSFTRAAQVNSVTQSAVSQTISALERQFQARLIERSKKNFRLTCEGEAVYEYCKRIIKSYGVIQSKIQELRGVISGEVRIATVYSIGLYELPPYLKRFLKLHPSVNTRVEYRHAEKVYDDVANNVVDLGLVAYPVRAAKLEVIPFRKEKLVLVCSPQNPLARQKSVRLKALNGQNFVGFNPDTPSWQALERVFKQERVQVSYATQFDNIDMVKRAVEMGWGVSILPEEAIVQELDNGHLASVRIEGDPVRPLGVIHKKDAILSPAMKAFIELLKTES